jgi:hypothetical protein
MAPSEICRLLGEAKFKEMFLSLNAAAMKLSLSEANLSSVRLPSQTSTRKRNDDWAKRLWQSVSSERPAPCKVFLFEWLRQTRTPMLVAFLDSIGVPHQKGLTDADFMKDTPDDKLLGAAKMLLSHPDFSHRDVAVYLLFLDDSNETDRFAALQLDKALAAG